MTSFAQYLLINAFAEDNAVIIQHMDPSRIGFNMHMLVMAYQDNTVHVAWYVSSDEWNDLAKLAVVLGNMYEELKH